MDAATGAIRARDAGATGVLAVDPTGRFAAMGGARLAIWDLTTAQRVIALPEPVNAIAWSGSCAVATGCRVVTVGGTLDVWDVLSLRHIPVAEETNAQAVAISEDGTTIASAGWGPSVSLWRLDPRTDDAGRTAVAAEGAITAYDASSGTVARVQGGHLDVTRPDQPAHRFSVGSPTKVALLDGGSRALTVAPGQTQLWDAERGQPIALDPLCAGDLVAASPDGTLLASFRRRDRAVAVCEASTGARLAASRLDAAIEPITVLAVGDDGGVAVGGGGGIVARYQRDGDRLGSGTAIDVRFGGEPVAVTALALGRSRLAAGLGAVEGDGSDAANGRALIWDLEAGGEPIAFDVDQRQVVAVALLGEQDALLAVAGRDEPQGDVTVQVSESTTRRRLGRALAGLAGDVTYLGGSDTELVGIDGSGRAYRWAVDRDPRSRHLRHRGPPARSSRVGGRGRWRAGVRGLLSPVPVTPPVARRRRGGSALSGRGRRWRPGRSRPCRRSASPDRP